MRPLHLHCGLHKTGSTALQDALNAAAGRLESRGFLYPRAGIPEGASGQHNLAWELARDRRYSPRLGTLADLAREIAGFDGSVVLSSEDFESSLLRPARWRGLLSRAAAAGFAPRFVVYLREPVAYLESLYVENLKHGFGGEYRVAAREVVERGALTFNEWEFCFDYPRIAGALASLEGVPTVFRDYGRLAGGHVVADFARVVGLRDPALEADGARRANARAGAAASLAHFARNRAWSWFRASDARPLARAAAFLLEGWPVRLETPAQLRDRLRARLAPSLRFLEGLEDTAALAAPREGNAKKAPAAERVDIAGFFSAETFLTICDLAQALDGRTPSGTAERLRERWRERVRLRDGA